MASSLALSAEILAPTLNEMVSTSATEKLIQVWHKAPHLRSLAVAAVPVVGSVTMIIGGSS